MYSEAAIVEQNTLKQEAVRVNDLELRFRLTADRKDHALGNPYRIWNGKQGIRGICRSSVR